MSTSTHTHTHTHTTRCARCTRARGIIAQQQQNETQQQQIPHKTKQTATQHTVIKHSKQNTHAQGRRTRPHTRCARARNKNSTHSTSRARSPPHRGPPVEAATRANASGRRCDGVSLMALGGPEVRARSQPIPSGGPAPGALGRPSQTAIGASASHAAHWWPQFLRW